MRSKGHKDCKSFKDQELKFHSLWFSLNHHDLFKMGFGSKPKPKIKNHYKHINMLSVQINIGLLVSHA
jgi:hypothetical protein